MSAEDYWWYDRDEDNGEDRNAYLRELLAEYVFEGPAEGIIRLVIDQGFDVLSEKQAWVFHRHVIRHHFPSDCGRCGADLTWSNLLYHEGWCAWCHHQWSKDT